MVSPIKKSSFKEEETSKPEEKVVEPVTSQCAPLKEETAKTAAPHEEETNAFKEVLMQDTTSPEEEEQPNPVERTTGITQDEEAAPRDTDGLLPKKTTSNVEGDATSTKDVEALALVLLQQEDRATRAIQQEPVAAVENGMSRSPL
jgi:hypothetical protein